MRRTSFADMPCSIARSLDLIGDWWTPLIVRDLHLGVNRFDDLVEDLGVSRNLLAARMKALESAGLIERRLYQERPPRYDYGLSEAGRDLAPVLMALMAWGDRWVAPKAGPPLRLVHRGCGKAIAPHVACPHCGDALTADNVDAFAGPGGKAARGARVLARRLRAKR